MTLYKIICNKNSKETEITQTLVELVMQIFKYFFKEQRKYLLNILSNWTTVMNQCFDELVTETQNSSTR